MEVVMTGKKALVTGGSRGIGKEVVKVLSKAGCQVWVVCILKDEMEKLKSEIPSVVTAYCDLSDWDETERVLGELPPMDYLVNNAGIADGQGVGEVTNERFDVVMNINVKAVIHISQIVTKKMKEAGIRGSIVNLASYAAKKMYPGAITYCCAKISVDHLTRAFAKTFAGDGIRVNAVNPYIVKTDMGKHFADLTSQYEPEDKIPLNGRYVLPEEVAKCIFFLLSDWSSMVTGETLRIDGGMWLV